MLPRIFCYFDDVLSAEDGGILCEDVGQLRAIRDYNDSHDSAKIRPVAGLQLSRKIRSKWPSQIYVHHAFEHPDYSTYIHKDQNRQLEI
jgi:hypothetical protein